MYFLFKNIFVNKREKDNFIAGERTEMKTCSENSCNYFATRIIFFLRENFQVRYMYITSFIAD